MTISYLFLFPILGVNSLQLYVQVAQSKDLNINLYEIRIDENFVNDKDLIEAYLFDCQCAIFLVDISNSASFDLIKSLIVSIDNDKFPYLKKILVENKLDLESQKQVSGFDIKEFLDKNPSMQSEKLSLKDGDSVQDLLSKIYSAVNESNKDLPINKVYVTQTKIGSRFEDCEGSISLILIGDSQVGKTNFLTRYIDNKFHETFISTMGIEREIKGVKIDNKLYKLTIWDTAGQERFQSLPRKYYKNVDGVLLLYDVCDESTFKDVNNWLNDVKQNSNRNNETDISLFLIGNKIDKDGRVITKEKGEQLAKSLGMKFFEISCKTNINIHETMARMVLECYKRVTLSSNANEGVKLTTKNTKSNKGGCCKK